MQVFFEPQDLAEAVRSDLLDTIKLVEAESSQKAQSAERKSAFLVELENMADSAIATGIREPLILSAISGALADLQHRQPSISKRLGEAQRKFAEPLSVARRKEHPWVFFSYAHSDEPIVNLVATELRKLKVRVWVDQQQIVADQTIIDEINQGLESASALVFFASRSSMNSQWARHELDYFMRKRVSEAGGPPVIPVLIEEVELPALMRDILYVDMKAATPKNTARRIAASVHGVAFDEII